MKNLFSLKLNLTPTLWIVGFFALFAALPAQSALLFSENFNYALGSNLAGQNGGSGFSSAWIGGDSTIVAGLGGTGNAVQAGSSISNRSLSTTYSTSGNPYYFSYLMNASSFSGGNYVGLSLWNGGSEEMFFGIPWNAQKFGFDAHGGNGVADIKSIDFTPAAGTTYLVAFGMLPSLTGGKVDLKMWATSDLAVNPSALVAGAANAELIGSRNNFSFNTFKLAGNYAGSLKVSGIGSAPIASEAINFSIQSAASVPEPGQVAASLLLLAGIGGYAWMKRRKPATAPSKIS